MKKLILSVLFNITFMGFSLLWPSSMSVANNQGFPLVDKRLQQAKKKPARYFVKYRQGKAAALKAVLESYQFEIVETLSQQHVFVITGETAKLDQLNEHDSVEYIEPEPLRTLSVE